MSTRFSRPDQTLSETLSQWKDAALESGGNEENIRRVARRIELLGKNSNKMRAVEADDIKMSLDRLLGLLAERPNDLLVACQEDALVTAVAAYSLVSSKP